MIQKPYLITVFHRNPFYAGAISDRLPPKDLGWPTLYTPAALVETYTLEEAYNATQSIDGPWWKKRGSGVQKLAKTPCRSTSVGDVIGYGRSYWVVADMGFSLVLRLQRGDVVDVCSTTKSGITTLEPGMVFSSTQSGIQVYNLGYGIIHLTPKSNSIVLRFVRRCGLHQQKKLIELTENLAEILKGNA